MGNPGRGGGGGGAAPIIGPAGGAGEALANAQGINLTNARGATVSADGRTVTVGSGSGAVRLNVNGQQAVQNSINARGGRGGMTLLQPNLGGRGGRGVRLDGNAMQRTNEAITRARRTRTGRGGVTQR